MGFEAFWINYREMQSIGIPGLREDGTFHSGTQEPMVSHWFFKVSGALPAIPFAVGGFRGRRQRRDADGRNHERLCFIRFLKLF